MEEADFSPIGTLEKYFVCNVNCVRAFIKRYAFCLEVAKLRAPRFKSPVVFLKWSPVPIFMVRDFNNACSSAIPSTDMSAVFRINDCIELLFRPPSEDILIEVSNVYHRPHSPIIVIESKLGNEICNYVISNTGKGKCHTFLTLVSLLHWYEICDCVYVLTVRTVMSMIWLCF